MQAANTRMTLASILGTVQTTATTLSSTMDAVNSAVGMLNKTVTDAAHRQTVRSKLDNAIFEKTLHQEKAVELHQSRMVVKNYVSKLEEDDQKSFETAYNELSQVLGHPIAS